MSSTRSLRRLLAVVALVVTVLVTGCSTDTGSQDGADDQTQTPSATPTEAQGQPCSSVWVEGATLPRGYGGCDDGGSFVAKDVLPCSSGQRMVRFDDHYYAVQGGTISETESVLDDDVGYRDAVASCRG